MSTVAPVPSIAPITPFEEVHAQASAICRRPWHPVDLIVAVTFGLVLCGAMLPLRVFFALGGIFLAATLWQRRVEADWQIHEAALVDRFDDGFTGAFLVQRAFRADRGGATVKKIYLAARYSRREELCWYRDILTDMGFVVTSRWLNGNHQIDDAGLSLQAKEEERVRFAQEDWDDLMEADVCISFTEIPRVTNSRGGRRVEFGAALAAGKRCIIVGPRENVFHCLPNVEFFSDWGICSIALRPDPDTDARYA